MTQYLVTTFKDSTGQPHEHLLLLEIIRRLQLLRQRVKEAKEKYEKQVKRDAVIKSGSVV